MTYQLTLTQDDIDTIGFVGGRYGWSSALLAFEAGTHELAEYEAWAIRDAIDSDTEGGHDVYPMLDGHSELAAKLTALCWQIV